MNSLLTTADEEFRKTDELGHLSKVSRVSQVFLQVSGASDTLTAVQASRGAPRDQNGLLGSSGASGS